MLRIHRSRYTALRVEGVRVSTETIECGVQQGTPRHRTILDVPWRRTHVPNERQSESSDRRNGRGNET